MNYKVIDKEKYYRRGVFRHFECKEKRTDGNETSE